MEDAEQQLNTSLPGIEKKKIKNAVFFFTESKPERFT